MLERRIRQDGRELVLYFSQLTELFAALHVLARPEHHLPRLTWAERVEAESPALVEALRGFAKPEMLWLALHDAAAQEGLAGLAVPEGLAALGRLDNATWNRYTGPYALRPGRQALCEALALAGRIYGELLREELHADEAMAARVLPREAARFEAEGWRARTAALHERIRVEEGQLRFIKGEVYTVPLEEIEEIHIAFSTFLAPHLILMMESHRLFLTRHLPVAPGGEAPPEDLRRLLAAIADPTRLRILRLLDGKGLCTVELAKELGVSPPAVTKALKLMEAAGLVRSTRQGRTVVYSADTTQLDNLSYYIYEYLRA